MVISTRRNGVRGSVPAGSNQNSTKTQEEQFAAITANAHAAVASYAPQPPETAITAASQASPPPNTAITASAHAAASQASPHPKTAITRPPKKIAKVQNSSAYNVLFGDSTDDDDENGDQGNTESGGLVNKKPAATLNHKPSAKAMDNSHSDNSDLDKEMLDSLNDSDADVTKQKVKGNVEEKDEEEAQEDEGEDVMVEENEKEEEEEEEESDEDEDDVFTDHMDLRNCASTANTVLENLICGGFDFDPIRDSLTFIHSDGDVDYIKMILEKMPTLFLEHTSSITAGTNLCTDSLMIEINRTSAEATYTRGTINNSNFQFGKLFLTFFAHAFATNNREYYSRVPKDFKYGVLHNHFDGNSYTYMEAVRFNATVLYTFLRDLQLPGFDRVFQTDPNKRADLTCNVDPTYICQKFRETHAAFGRGIACNFAVKKIGMDKKSIGWVHHYFILQVVCNKWEIHNNAKLARFSRFFVGGRANHFLTTRDDSDPTWLLWKGVQVDSDAAP